MKKPTAFLISCSEHYNHRFRVLDGCLRSKGFHTTYITSDFDHTDKTSFVCEVSGCVQIHAIPYRKNLSAARILSHAKFARDVYRYLEELEQEPAVLVVLLPPNFLTFYMAKYKRRHPKVKLIFDVFDMWPETFPSNKLGKLLSPFFSVWAWLRDHNLPAADWVMSECDHFRHRFEQYTKCSSTVYLCLDSLEQDIRKTELREDAVDLCYLGAINNVIGITEICELIKEIKQQKPITLHVIGMGERQQFFVDSARNAGAEVIWYGPVFDQNKKQEIINRCHFGLNVVNQNTCIGLTMKSVDYFRFGLPIISNVPSDTAQVIAQYNAGIPVEADSAIKIANMSAAENMHMRENVRRLFMDRFSSCAVEQEYQNLLDAIL